jgi:isopentenyldiphosphate isomerase
VNEAPELFDLCDAEGHLLGRSKAREEVHRDGDWHRSAHIWIFTSDGRLLFQRRAADKDTWPACLDASIGGHYRAGEDISGIVREAHEELGIGVELAELLWLGLRRVESREPGIVDREVQDIYVLRRDLPLTAYQPDPVEIDGLALLDAGGAAQLHDGSLDHLDAEVLPRGAATPRTAAITSDDLIPGRGPYIAALARAVGDVLAGRTPRGL